MKVCIATGAFDVQAECAAFVAGRQGAGTLVSFAGTCRADTDGDAGYTLDIQQPDGAHWIEPRAQDHEWRPAANREVG